VSETTVKKDDFDEFPAERTAVSIQPPTPHPPQAQAQQHARPNPLHTPVDPPRAAPAPAGDKLRALKSLSLSDGREARSRDRDYDRDRDVGRKSSWLPWILLFIVGGAFGAREYMRHKSPQPAVAEGSAAAKVKIATVQPTGSTTQTLQAAGYVAVRTPITVGTPIGGQIKKVLVEDGQSVSANQLIAQLNDSQPRAEMALARARASAAERVLRRTRKLFEAQAATPADLDRAQGEVEVARAATIPLAQKIQQSKIVSPVDGTILEVLAHPGEILVGNAGVVKMADLREMVAEVDVNESDLPTVQRKQTVDLTSEAYPDRTYSGTVSEIAATADRARGTVKVKVELKVPDGSLRPGMSVKASFKPRSNGEQPRLLIPRGAVDRGAVWLVGPGETVSRHTVTTHQAGPSLLEVDDGLKAGDRIVVEGTSGLTEGAKVQ
jgi:RND family efflux transporter MFP subunit